MFEKTPVEVPGGSAGDVSGASGQGDGKFIYRPDVYGMKHGLTFKLRLPRYQCRLWCSPVQIVNPQQVACIEWDEATNRHRATFGSERSDPFETPEEALRWIADEYAKFIATALAATDQSRSENSQSAERKASDDASTNQKDAVGGLE